MVIWAYRTAWWEGIEGNVLKIVRGGLWLGLVSETVCYVNM